MKDEADQSEYAFVMDILHRLHTHCSDANVQEEVTNVIALLESLKTIVVTNATQNGVFGSPNDELKH